MARSPTPLSFHGFGGRRAGWRLTTLRYHPGFRVGAVFGVVVGFFLSAYLLTFALADDGVSRINREANRVRPHLDATLPDGVYDCEDYAWAKITALWSAGLGALDPRAVVVRIPGVRQLHMVVELNDGRVLDNRYGRVQTRAGLEKWPGYVFL